MRYSNIMGNFYRKLVGLQAKFHLSARWQPFVNWTKNCLIGKCMDVLTGECPTLECTNRVTFRPGNVVVTLAGLGREMDNFHCTTVTTTLTCLILALVFSDVRVYILLFNVFCTGDFLLLLYDLNTFRIFWKNRFFLDLFKSETPATFFPASLFWLFTN